MSAPCPPAFIRTPDRARDPDRPLETAQPGRGALARHHRQTGGPTGPHDDDRPLRTRPLRNHPVRERPLGTRTVGTRPVRTRTVGTRPVGTGPFRTRRDTHPSEPAPQDDRHTGEPRIGHQQVRALADHHERHRLVHLGQGAVHGQQVLQAGRLDQHGGGPANPVGGPGPEGGVGPGERSEQPPHPVQRRRPAHDRSRSRSARAVTSPAPRVSTRSSARST
jgi:hypothetical protein